MLCTNWSVFCWSPYLPPPPHRLRRLDVKNSLSSFCLRGLIDAVGSAQLYTTAPPLLIHIAPAGGVGFWLLRLHLNPLGLLFWVANLRGRRVSLYSLIDLLNRRAFAYRTGVYVLMYIINDCHPVSMCCKLHFEVLWRDCRVWSGRVWEGLSRNLSYG